jgi:hypothetical protein
MGCNNAPRLAERLCPFLSPSTKSGGARFPMQNKGEAALKNHLLALANPTTPAVRPSSLCCDRRQAARHSPFVMCVACSQKPMQSSSVLPPPPGMLGAASVALVLDGLDEATVTVPPALKVVVVTGGDSGATTEGCVAGVATAATGAGIAAVGAAVGEVVRIVAGVVVVLPPVAVELPVAIVLPPWWRRVTSQAGRVAWPQVTCRCGHDRACRVSRPRARRHHRRERPRSGQRQQQPVKSGEARSSAEHPLSPQCPMARRLRAKIPSVVGIHAPPGNYSPTTARMERSAWSVRSISRSRI